MGNLARRGRFVARHSTKVFAAISFHCACLTKEGLAASLSYRAWRAGDITTRFARRRSIRAPAHSLNIMVRIASMRACSSCRSMADGLVMRYDTHGTKDRLPPGEGAFLACSFWLVDNLVMQGPDARGGTAFRTALWTLQQCRLAFRGERPSAKRLVGNLPQSFSHIALVNSAHNLVLSQNSLKQRAGHDRSA